MSCQYCGWRSCDGICRDDPTKCEGCGLPYSRCDCEGEDGGWLIKSDHSDSLWDTTDDAHNSAPGDPA